MLNSYSRGERGREARSEDPECLFEGRQVSAFAELAGASVNVGKGLFEGRGAVAGR